MNIYKIKYRILFTESEGIVLAKNYEEAVNIAISYIKLNGDKNVDKSSILGFEILYENVLLAENYLIK